MKAVVLDGEHRFIRLESREQPKAGPGEVVIRVKAAALNHRDLNMLDNPNASKVRSFILGSDGAGVVHSVGEGVTAWHSGDEVMINSMIACGHCESCLRGEHSLCLTGSLVGGSKWDGTFAEYVKVPAEYVVHKPKHLTFIQAAALPMALGTAWRVVWSRGKVQPGETVLVHGIGGGVALHALQIAAQVGARVIVTSSSSDKIEKALALGAFAGINYQTEDVALRVNELTNGRGVDVVVDGAGQLALSLKVAGLNSRVVNYGLLDYYGNTEVTIDAAMFYQKQLSLIGSSMNTQPEFQAAVSFVNQTGLQPIVSNVFPMDEAAAAFNLLRQGGQFGKVVLSMEA